MFNVLFRMPPCHQNQVWPPLPELWLQEVAAHGPQGYLWCQCAERPPRLIHIELEEDFPCQ